jgi:uncharacterized Ntn-hydrolase superfamily protein
MTMLSRENHNNLLAIAQKIATVIQLDVKRLGMYDGSISGTLDNATKKALEDWVGMNNFENRMREPGNQSIYRVMPVAHRCA